jgi:hypothetical protein
LRLSSHAVASWIKALASRDLFSSTTILPRDQTSEETISLEQKELLGFVLNLIHGNIFGTSAPALSAYNDPQERGGLLVERWRNFALQQMLYFWKGKRDSPEEGLGEDRTPASWFSY